MTQKKCIQCKKELSGCRTKKFCSHQCYWSSMKGRKISEEQYKHIIEIGKKSRFEKGHIGYKSMLGKKHTDYAKKRMSISHKKNPTRYWLGKKRHSMTLDKHPMWKGGRIKDNDGYIWVIGNGHPNQRKNGYILEHRLVMSKKIKRPLKNFEVVHHIDGNRENNDISNLELHTMSSHAKLHMNERSRDKAGKLV